MSTIVAQYNHDAEIARLREELDWQRNRVLELTGDLRKLKGDIGRDAAELREKVKLVQEANEWWEAQGAGRLKGTAGEMAYFMLKRYRAALETK